MAETTNSQDPTNNVGDVLGQNADESTKLDNLAKKLDQTNEYLSQIAKLSQAGARDAYEGDGHFRSEYNRKRSDKSSSKDGRNATGKKRSFSDAFKGNLSSSLFGFDNPLKGVMGNLAKEMGVAVEDVPGTFGEMLGKNLANSIKNSKLGSRFVGNVNNMMAKASDSLTGKLSSFIKSSSTVSQGASEAVADAASGATSVVSDLSAEAGQTIGGIGENAALAGEGLGSMTKSIGVAGFGIQALVGVVSAFGKGLKAYTDFLRKHAYRDIERQKDLVKASMDRASKDIGSMIKRPFEILEQAADELYKSWESNIHTINQTQGYNKSDLMDLMSAFAQRLRDEGLSDVVAGTEVISSLTKVLESGLSGKIAEEFAYQAVKLNAAVPTQDFFNFASSYASVAANAIKNGESQAAAIEKANKSLEDFTSDVLYASRELTGGFTTGLQNAADLYEKAVKISQAARTNNASEISSVLTSVAAVTGAIAPDLASSLTDAIYSAATGGNASNLVALRSLAGINASNTEFLKAFAQNPKQIISNMLNTLGGMYSQSPDAFMEKAEGYAELFGLSAEAFQRVDFNYLAQQIASMNSSNQSLAENMALLQSGQSTTTAEQEKANQINKYMIEQGLAYMIDNQVAQAIQQHMWDEELAAQLMDAQYAVDLTGESRTALLDIRQNLVGDLLSNIPVIGRFVRSGIETIKGFVQTSDAKEDWTLLQADLAKIVASKKVGSGGDFEALKAVSYAGYGGYSAGNYLDLLGITKSYVGKGQAIDFGAFNFVGPILEKYADNANSIYSNITDTLKVLSVASKLSGESIAANLKSMSVASSGQKYEGSTYPSSVYTWGILASKLESSIASSLLQSSKSGSTAGALSTSSAQSSINKTVFSKLEEFLDPKNIRSAIESGMSLSQWISSSSKLGIADIESFGITQEDLTEAYKDAMNEIGFEEQSKMKDLEREWYEQGTKFVSETFWSNFNDPLTSQLSAFQEEVSTRIIDFRDLNIDAIKSFKETFIEKIIDLRSDVQNVEVAVKQYNPFLLQNWSTYITQWQERWNAYSKYYLEHEIYTQGKSKGALKLSKLEAVQEAEKKGKGDVVNALAEYLTTNSWNLEDLQDPQIQTNALLSQILIVLNAIMNQNNTKSVGWSFSDTLSSLATGKPI